jgi:transposase InsO family protein
VTQGDNGSALKATTVHSTLSWLGVTPSYSRPRPSEDCPYAESLFRTAKHRPEFPSRGFADLNAARAPAAGFVHWYRGAEGVKDMGQGVAERRRPQSCRWRTQVSFGVSNRGVGKEPHQ